MDLGQLTTHSEARVVAVDLEHGVRLRLGELGLRAGAHVRVTHRAAFGGRVVAVGADRFAVDSRTCARIEVEPVTVQVPVPPEPVAAAVGA